MFVSEQKMLRVRDEELSRSGSRGRGPPRKGVGHQTEEEEDDEEEEGFSESELELYEQYRAAGYRDLVSVQNSFWPITSQIRHVLCYDAYPCCRCGTVRKRTLSRILWGRRRWRWNTWRDERRRQRRRWGQFKLEDWGLTSRLVFVPVASGLWREIQLFYFNCPVEWMFLFNMDRIKLTDKEDVIRLLVKTLYKNVINILSTGNLFSCRKDVVDFSLFWQIHVCCLLLSI